MPLTRDPLNAFLDLPEVPVPNAESGPLGGLTLAVKDIFDVAGYKTGCGNFEKASGAQAAVATAPTVQQLLDAGSRFAGKTQTDELAFSLIGQNAHFPQPVNPAAPDHVTGGSSSGSAAAVAGKLADIATGSDTGGSIRAPASFCGLIGLRTTHGRISLEGTMPLAPSFDTFGWFAKDIGTYEKVGEVLLRADLPHKGEGKVRPLRLAALDDLLLGNAEAAEYRRMANVVADVIGTMAVTFALSRPIDDFYWCFRKLQAYEAWAVHGPWLAQKDRGLGPGVKERFEFGSTITSETAAAETKRRSDFRAELAQILGDDGFLVLPTVPGASLLKSLSFGASQAYRERALHLLCLSGLSGFPQITLPLGSVDDAPFGISLLGPQNSDLTLVRLGRRILESVGKA
jgi:amidase